MEQNPRKTSQMTAISATNVEIWVSDCGIYFATKSTSSSTMDNRKFYVLGMLLQVEPTTEVERENFPPKKNNNVV